MKSFQSQLLLCALLIFPVSLFGQIDYASEVQPIFDSNCTGCHGGQSGVTLTSYDNAISSVGNQYGTEIINPENASESPIVDKISNDNPEFGDRMPRNGPPYLDQDEIDTIVQWINEGANQTPTSLETGAELPSQVRITGNYPNPFNPATTINLEFPFATSYTYTVVDLQGRTVLTGQRNAVQGEQTLRVSLQNQSSGAYIFQIRYKNQNGGASTQSHMITLLK